MSDCLCDTCPLGAPNLTYAAVHCLNRFQNWPDERAGKADLPLRPALPARMMWRASETMPNLIIPLAA